MKNILIISQVRMGSSRLPGKVLKEVLGKPMLWYLIRRLQQVKTPNKLILAIANSEFDLPLIEFAKKHSINYYVGSENNVLDRYYQAAKKFNGDIIVRITSDCPLADPNVIDYGLEIFLKGNYDYVSNVLYETYPGGMDVEIISFKALEKAWKEAELNYDKEHVSPYIINHPEEFNLKNFKNHINLSSFWLILDYPEDYLFLKKIIEKFYNSWTSFKFMDVIYYLKENPELLKINSQYQRNVKLLKSLIFDLNKQNMKH